MSDLSGQPISLVILLGAAGLLPFVFMALTSFLKISTVLQITKSAIGAQNVPSNTVVMALAAALSLVAMAPVGQRIAERAAPVLETPPSRSAELAARLFDATAEPLRAFLLDNSSAKERARFAKLSQRALGDDSKPVPPNSFSVVVPAFMVSELIEAFSLGFAIFLPFLVIDLLVGNVLLALGMQMMSPAQVSLPFKLLLFVAADGWGLLSQALIMSYRAG